MEKLGRKNVPGYLKLLFTTMILLFLTGNVFAATYDWIGYSSTDWKTPGNWAVGGVIQTTNYPGMSSTDVAQIGVSYYFIDQPTVSGAVSVASVIIGSLSTVTLTVNSTLAVSGNVTVNNYGNYAGITHAITGTGSVSCNNFYLGDNTVPSAPFLISATYLTTLNFSLSNLTVSQNLALTTTSSISSSNPIANVNNPVFNFNSGTITIGNILQTIDASDANTPLYLTIYAGASSSAQFLMNPSTGNSSTLNLSGANALSLDGNAGYVDFYGTAGGTSTVNYNGAVNQEVYSSTAPYSATGRQSPNGLDRSPAMYQNLTFSGSQTKKADGGNITAGGNLTLAAASTETVDFASNSPIVTVGGNFVSNTGTTLNQGGTGTMTITGTSNNAGTLNQKGSGNITFTGALVSTALIAQTGSGSIIASGGITNSGTMSQGSGTIGNITVTGILTNSGTVSQTTGNISVSGNVVNSGYLTLGTANLTISGNYSNNGTYTQSTGSTIFNGSSPTLTDGGSGTSFNAVYFNGGGTAKISSGNFSVSSIGVLTMANSTTLNANGNLTLISAAASSATVAAIPSGSGITNNVNVQRYITGGAGYRGYRLISSPVYSATVSSNNVYSINYLTSSVFLTGAGPIATTGFDKVGNPTLYLYREDQTPSNASFTSGNFEGVSSINNSPTYKYSVTGAGTSGTFYLPVGNGVMFFFRGNKTSASLLTETSPAYTTPGTVTTSTTGTLNQGQVVVHDWYTPSSAYLGYTGSGATGTNSAVRGFNLVGNPYASSIDWEQYNTTTPASGIYATSNISKTIYEWNPKTRSYSTYMAGHGGSTNNGQEYIMSGEGFFVQVANNSTNPQLTFNESAKVTNQTAGVNLFMSTTRAFDAVDDNISDPHLRLQLAADSINTDDIYIGFKSTASAQFDINEDAPYMAGAGQVRISSFSSDDISLAINKLPLPGIKQTTIPLFVTASPAGSYKLNMTEIKGIPQLYQIWLMDRFNKDSLDIRHNSTYAFDVVADTNSYGRRRFQLVIRQDPALAVHLLNFAARKATGGAQVTWKTENEENYTNFFIERSTDKGATFVDLAGIVSTAAGTYNYLDQKPGAGANQYRLKLTDLNGTISYSNIVTLMYANEANNLINNYVTVYPNPAINTVNVAIATNAGSNPPYVIQITNTSGVLIKKITSAQANWRGSVTDLMPGTYIIKVRCSKDNAIVGSTKFVKT